MIYFHYTGGRLLCRSSGHVCVCVWYVSDMYSSVCYSLSLAFMKAKLCLVLYKHNISGLLPWVRFLRSGTARFFPPIDAVFLPEVS